MEKINIEKIIWDSVQKDEIKYFTQFNICKSFQLACKGIKDSNIEDNVVNLRIKSAKRICTIEGVSIEGENLTGQKLILIGKANTKTIIRCPKNVKKLCVLEKNIPFSTFITIPKKTCKDECINLKYLIEDVTALLIDENKIFITITLMMQYINI